MSSTGSPDAEAVAALRLDVWRSWPILGVDRSGADEHGGGDADAVPTLPNARLPASSSSLSTVSLAVHVDVLPPSGRSDPAAAPST